MKRTELIYGQKLLVLQPFYMNLGRTSDLCHNSFAPAEKLFTVNLVRYPDFGQNSFCQLGTVLTKSRM